jgi:hypothetical protein
VTTTAEAAPARHDAQPDVVREWLAYMYEGMPGLLGISYAPAGGGPMISERFGDGEHPLDGQALDAATRYIVRCDTEKRPRGIYGQVTTLSGHPDRGRGDRTYAHALGCLWADADFGTIGHAPGPDELPMPPDFAAVRRVIAESGLPDPTFWGMSGGGAYPIWRPDRWHVVTDADRDEIEAITQGWQKILAASAYRLGYHWDKGVGDLPRLLRIIGTVNRKVEHDRVTRIEPGSGVIHGLDEMFAAARSLLPAAQEALEQADRERHERTRHRTGVPLPPPRAPRPASARVPGGEGPLDVLSRTASWADVLAPHGWTYQGVHGDGREEWLRPATAAGAPSSAYSLLCDEYVAVNFSEAAGLPTGRLAPGSKLTKGTVFAHLNYSGDTSAAARDIMRAAAGHGAAPAAAGLPAYVLGEVARACLTEDRERPSLRLVTPPDFADIPYDDEPPPDDEPPDDDPRPRLPPGLLPETFWGARQELRHIRQAGHSRNRSGDVAFLAVLTRLSGLVSHHIRADTGIAGYASLNLFGGLIGPSGVGKSTGVDVAELLLPTPEGLDFRDSLPIGSGEGIAEVFIDVVEEATGEVRKGRGGTETPVTVRVRKQVRHNAFFYVDEGASLTRLMKERSGSTLGETLRSAAVGQTIGQTNASKETSRYIPKGSYSMGLLVGFQPSTVAPLFDEVEEGTPQRFLWLQVIDPSIPDEQPPWPGELRGWQHAITASCPTLITFDDAIRAELRRVDLAKARGEIPAEELGPLDSHAPLMRIKVASLLAILAGRLYVTPDDWHLSELVWAASCATRNAVLADVERKRQHEQEKRTQARIAEEVRVEEAKLSAENARTERTVIRIATRIAGMVHAAGEPQSRSELRDRIAGRDKKHVGEAIAYAVLREWVREENKRLAPGRMRPTP